jgi:hypothetical protein
MALPSASKNRLSRSRSLVGSLSMAKAKIVVKTVSGKMASLAAAAIGLDGTRPSRNSLKAGGGGTAAASPSAALSAVPAVGSSGQRSSSRGITSAAMIDEDQSKTRNQVTERPASFPARAASAVLVMPVTRSETTKGTIVILSAFNHSPPMGSAAAVTASPQAVPDPARPSSKPKRRAIRMISAAIVRTVLRD